MSDMNSFQDAFYIIAKELGFDYAQPLSPREVFEQQMLPRIRELIATQPATHGDEAASGANELSCCFGLSYAAWLAMPRVMLEAMPDAWQGKLAKLLDEYGREFPARINHGLRVHLVDERGRVTKMPEWLSNYRHPDQAALAAMRCTGDKQ